MMTITVLAAMFYGNAISVIAGLIALLGAYVTVNLRDSWWFPTKTQSVILGAVAVITLTAGLASIVTTILFNAYLI